MKPWRYHDIDICNLLNQFFNRGTSLVDDSSLIIPNAPSFQSRSEVCPGGSIVFRVALKDPDFILLLNQPGYELTHFIQIAGVLNLVLIRVPKVNITMIHDPESNSAWSVTEFRARWRLIKRQAEDQIRK